MITVTHDLLSLTRGESFIHFLSFPKAAVVAITDNSGTQVVPADTADDIFDQIIDAFQ